MVSPIRENVEKIREAMASAASRSGRRLEDVLLVAVTKTRTIGEMMEVLRCGVTSLGESRVQELLWKREQWPPDMEVQWRLIGHLQRNKARKAVEMVDSVDSVDSIELAELLSRVMESRRTVLPVLLEVNTSGEASKHGVPPEEALPLLETILEGFPHIRPEGFMTIGPLGGDEREVRRAFALLRSVAEEARERFSMPLKELSMGMSGDFQWGIEEGSTMVRVGTALFGPRP